MSLRTILLLTNFLLFVISGVSSATDTLGYPLELDDQELQDNYDDYYDEIFLITAYIKPAFELTISFIEDAIVILLKPIYYIFVSIESIQIETMNSQNNTNYSLSQFVNNNVNNTKINMSTENIQIETMNSQNNTLSQFVNNNVNNTEIMNSSNNESTTEYSDILVEMLPQWLSVFYKNEVEIVAPDDAILPKEELTSATPKMASSKTTIRATTTTTTTNPPPPLQETQEEKSFFNEVVDFFGNFLG